MIVMESHLTAECVKCNLCTDAVALQYSKFGCVTSDVVVKPIDIPFSLRYSLDSNTQSSSLFQYPYLFRLLAAALLEIFHASVRIVIVGPHLTLCLKYRP